MFGFRWPTPEPSALSPAYGANFSPDRGRAQGQGKASSWGGVRDTFRQLLLDPGKGEPETALRSPPAFPFPSFSLPRLSPLFYSQLLHFLLPRSCALRRDPESKASRPYPGEAAGEQPAAPGVCLGDLGEEALRRRSRS